jgi:hypothetical protein
VPREALQGGPANRHVYIKHMSIPHAFERVSVQIGISSNGRVEILDGLLPGDEVVTTGSYSLGFAGSDSGPSLKEAMDAAHGHEHNQDGSEKTADDHAEDDHDHAAAPSHTREIFFMASTAILALLLLFTSLRRPTLTNTEVP